MINIEQDILDSDLFSLVDKIRWPNCTASYWNLNGTNFFFIVFSEGESRVSTKNTIWRQKLFGTGKVPLANDEQVSFQDVLEYVDPKIGTELLFHLDVFNNRGVANV